jgi:5-methylcytosine-specific restriction endonuclease McrA
MSVYAKGMKNCIKCRKEFIPCNRETKYCSHECFNEVRRRGKFVNCGICGKTVYRKRKNLKKSNFCSIDCLGAAKSVAWSIEWRRDRKIFAAKYRGLVLLRDNYTCQKCGIKQTNLEVHHVKPFRIFRELRFRLDNCVTLCPSCHILEDKWRRMKERAENKQVLEIH